MARNLEKYRVRILCEDKKHYDFIRSFMVAQGIRDTRKFDSITLPEGTQSGEQYVRDRFIAEYRKYIRVRENKILVVVQDIDKDWRTPENAKSDFNKLVQEDNLNPLNATDKLLFIFPKKNIETWLVWLAQDVKSDTIDETKDYKHSQNQMTPALAGKKAGKLYTESRTNAAVCANAPKSLVFACMEFESLCSMI